MPHNILFVDDEAHWGPALQARLGKAYALHHINTLNSVRRALKENTYRLVLTNWNLEPARGFLDNLGAVVVSQMLQEHPLIPCVVFTASPLHAQIQATFPAVLVIAKQTENISELVDVVQRVTEAGESPLFIRIARELALTSYQLISLMSHPEIIQAIEQILAQNPGLGKIEAFDLARRSLNLDNAVGKAAVKARRLTLVRESQQRQVLFEKEQALLRVLGESGEYSIQPLSDEEVQMAKRNKEALWEVQAKLGKLAPVTQDTVDIDIKQHKKSTKLSIEQEQPSSEPHLMEKGSHAALIHKQAKLSVVDRNQLSQELRKLPAWKQGLSGERSVLSSAGVPEDWIDELHFTGTPATDARNVISQLENLGHLVDMRTHYALGALIDHIRKQAIDIEGKAFLSYLIIQYQLITDLDYLEQLNTAYALLHVPISNELMEMGWQTQLPLSPWLGPDTPTTLEAIWSKKTHFLDAVFLEKGAAVARTVCRIEDKAGSALGTGFSVGLDLVLTCHHVLPTDQDAIMARVRFDYRLDKFGNQRVGEMFVVKQAVCRSETENLDFVLLRLDGKPGSKEDIGYLKPTAKTLKRGTSAFIIQHPLGDSQKVVLQDNWITYVSEDHRRVQYITNTEHGSSGSPVCDENWDVVALHHSRAPLPSSPVTAKIRGNEGIPMTAILAEIGSYLP